MTWRQALIGYAACGSVAYVGIMLMIRFVEPNLPGGVWQGMGDKLARLQEEIEQRKNPGRLRKLKNASAKWVAQLGVALLVILTWPVAIGWKTWIWISLYRERVATLRKLQNIATSVGVPFVEGGEVTPVEQIYILDKITDAWKIDAPGFLDLVIAATDIVIMSKPHEVFFVAEEFLSFRGDELKSYCREHNLPEPDVNLIEKRLKAVLARHGLSGR